MALHRGRIVDRRENVHDIRRRYNRCSCYNRYIYTKVPILPIVPCLYTCKDGVFRTLKNPPKLSNYLTTPQNKKPAFVLAGFAPPIDSFNIVLLQYLLYVFEKTPATRILRYSAGPQPFPHRLL